MVGGGAVVVQIRLRRGGGFAKREAGRRLGQKRRNGATGARFWAHWQKQQRGPWGGGGGGGGGGSQNGGRGAVGAKKTETEPLGLDFGGHRRKQGRGIVGGG